MVIIVLAFKNICSINKTFLYCRRLNVPTRTSKENTCIYKGDDISTSAMEEEINETPPGQGHNRIHESQLVHLLKDNR